MLYKPTFCCQCGNKIEREKWSILTSRRFCENCEGAFRKEEYLFPAILISLTLVSSLSAIGHFLKTPEKPLTLTTKKISRESPEIYPPNLEKPKESGVTANQNLLQDRVPTVSLQKSDADSVSVIKARELQNAVDETVYFCGAQTKKGTPCSRKVKGYNRCWQHLGQTAMLPKNKLVAGG